MDNLAFNEDCSSFGCKKSGEKKCKINNNQQTGFFLTEVTK